jgi:hypothetical protein
LTTDWKPKWAPNTDLRSLTLSNVEGFLASRIDGRTTTAELGILTGLPRDQIAAVLTRLVGEGALLPAEVEPVVPGPKPVRPAVVSPAVVSPAADSPAADSPAAVSPAAVSPAGVSPADASPGAVLPAAVSPPVAAVASPAVDADASAAVEPSADGSPAAGESVPAPEPEAAVEPAEVGSGVTHLALYRERFHPLSPDERARTATFATGANLSALCFDPLPAVIRNLMENPRAGLEQARLIATHHHNAAGLEFLLERAELMRDNQVQRLLWRNPQLNEGQLRRLTQSKRLLELWKLSVSREATAQTRTNTARLLRSRWATAPAEERVELIFSTEGRALAGLSGLGVDGKTTALLCARSYGSMLLVQNLANWATTPPAVIAHLLRQPMVVRQPRLRNILSHHPNAPPQARRDS